jgi:hypothetical protein
MTQPETTPQELNSSRDQAFADSTNFNYHTLIQRRYGGRNCTSGEAKHRRRYR